MNSILFFDSIQYRILKESGANLSSITGDKLGEFFTSSDIYQMEGVTSLLMAPNELLFKLGVTGSLGLPENIYNMREKVSDEIKLNAPTIKQLFEKEQQLNAFCNGSDSIIIWVEPAITHFRDTNDMMALCALNIANAIKARLGFNDFKKVAPFSKLILNILNKNLGIKE